MIEVYLGNEVLLNEEIELDIALGIDIEEDKVVIFVGTGRLAT